MPERTGEEDDGKCDENPGTASATVCLTYEGGSIRATQQPMGKLDDRYALNSQPGTSANWRRPIYHSVRTPDTLDYMCVIQENTPKEGLLHTLIRHSRQWERLLPGLSESLGKIGSQNFQDVLREIATTYGGKNDAYRRFHLKRLSMTADDRKLLNNLEKQIHGSILRSVNNDSYLGATVNKDGHKQELFIVQESLQQGGIYSEVDVIMVVCMSDEKFFADPDRFADSRHVRIIITIFFLDKDEYNQKLGAGEIIK